MAKNSIVILIVFVYMLSINVPLVYYLEHQINFEYIVKYVCEQKDEKENMCLGNCYLKKKLSNPEANEKQSDNRRIEIPNSNISAHCNHTDEIVFDHTVKRRNYILANFKNSNQNFIKPETLPPKLLSV